ncbi:MAG: PfkB family carbohydrate kinase [Gemmataceae bacterium]
MLTVVGGCYREACLRPGWRQLYGSGVRAVAAARPLLPEPPTLVTAAAEDEARSLARMAATYDFRIRLHHRPSRIEFQYDHPLAPPRLHPDLGDIGHTPPVEVDADTVLTFSLIEATTRVTAKTLVYDPQAGRRAIPPSAANARAERLAIVANLGEVRAMLTVRTGQRPPAEARLAELGERLRGLETAAVVVVKDGVRGAAVVTGDGVVPVPAFMTPSVFPVGSGDVFSAVFAALWAVRGMTAADAARLASVVTARYCHTQDLTTPADPATLFSLYDAGPIEPPGQQPQLRPVYLAGPFWTLPQLWLVSEARRCLTDQGLEVFSPAHDVGVLGDDPTAEDVRRVATADLAGLDGAAAVLALLDGLDAGTLFEIGHARSRGIPVVGLAEAVPRTAITMLEGTGCFLTADFTTAIYLTGWEARR